MQIRMQNAEGLSRDQIQEFLRSSEPIEFNSGGREERYLWVERALAAREFSRYPSVLNLAKCTGQALGRIPLFAGCRWR